MAERSSNLGLLALLVFCSLSGSATALKYKYKGVLLDTSERRLATVKTGGVCMDIKCSFKPEDNADRRVIKSLTLAAYSEDTAAVQDITVVSKQYPNGKDPGLKYYTVSGNLINQKEMSLAVTVSNQKICQFKRFHCRAEFTRSNYKTVEAETKDQKPLAKLNTDDEWFTYVRKYIVDQVVAMGDEIDKKIASLEDRLRELNEEFNRHLDDLDGEREELNKKAIASIQDSSAQTIEKINENAQNTTKQIDEVKTQLGTAIDDLKDKLEQQISKKQILTKEKIKVTSGRLVNKVSQLSEENTDRLTDVKTKAKASIDSVAKTIETVNDDTKSSIKSIRDKMIESFNQLEEDLSTSTTNVLKETSKNSVELKTTFDNSLKSMSNVLSKAIDEVNSGVTTTEILIETKLGELKTSTTTQTNQLEKDVNTSLNDLKSNVKTRVDKLTDNVNGKVNTIEGDLSTGSTSLKKGLEHLQEETQTKVTELETSLTDEIEILTNEINTHVNNTSTTLQTLTLNLGDHVTQANDEATTQLDNVKNAMVKSVTGLQDSAVERVSKLNTTVNKQLGTMQTSTLQNVGQLSVDLSGDSSKKDEEMNKTLSSLEDTIDNRLSEVTNLLFALVSKVSDDTRDTIDNMNTKFNADFNSLSNTAKDVNTRTVQALGSVRSKIVDDIETAKTDLVGVMETAAQSTKEQLDSFDRDTMSSIETLQSNTLQQINEARAKNLNELASIADQIQIGSSNISTTNGITKTNLETFLGHTIKIQSDSDALDRKLDSTRKSYTQLESTLTNIDVSLGLLEKQSNSKFTSFAESLTNVAENQAEKLAKTTEGLNTLERTRADGQIATEVRFNGINHYLSNTSLTLYSELSRNFEALDDMIRESDSTLRDYLKPERCERGMGFTASASLQYVIIPKTEERDYEYLCDAHTDLGGWIIIQRRTTGTTDFYQDWEAYKSGFGDVIEDYWLGLERIHQLTTQAAYELRVDLTYQGSHKFAQYSTFSLGDEQSNYMMNLDGYTGTAGDSMDDTVGMGFSTYNRDNDNNRRSCAKSNVGGWWYNDCQHANLNGVWVQKNERGPRWNTFTGTMPVVTSEMKIRLKEPQVRR